MTWRIARWSLIPAGLAILPVLAAPAPTSRPADKSAELREPPLEMVVEIDGKKIDAVCDQPVVAEIGGRKTTLKISTRPYRTFRAAGVEFRYPAFCDFKVDDQGPGTILWTIGKGDETILLLRHDKPDIQAAMGAFMEGLIEAFDKQNVKQSGTTLQLKDRKLAGKRLTVRLGENSLYQDVFALRSREAGLVLVVQRPASQSPQQKGAVSLIRLVQESFRVLD
jgi:hypothetical protein